MKLLTATHTLNNYTLLLLTVGSSSIQGCNYITRTKTIFPEMEEEEETVLAAAQQQGRARSKRKRGLWEMNEMRRILMVSVNQ